MELEKIVSELKENSKVTPFYLSVEEKVRYLKENHSDEFKTIYENFINEIYDNIFYERKKHIVTHFKAVGKTYDSNIFTDNYVNFIRDLVNGFNLTVNDLKGTIPECYMKKENSFSKCHYTEKHICTIVEIKKDFWISTYNETPKKLDYINRIKDKLNIGIEILYHDYKN